MAELDALLEGMNLALRWRLHALEIQTVRGWVTSVISNQRRICTKGGTGMIVKRGLRIPRQLATEFGLKLQVVFVPSKENKADVLTG